MITVLKARVDEVGESLIEMRSSKNGIEKLFHLKEENKFVLIDDKTTKYIHDGDIPDYYVYDTLGDAIKELFDYENLYYIVKINFVSDFFRECVKTIEGIEYKKLINYMIDNMENTYTTNWDIYYPYLNSVGKTIVDDEFCTIKEIESINFKTLKKEAHYGAFDYYEEEEEKSIRNYFNDFTAFKKEEIRNLEEIIRDVEHCMLSETADEKDKSILLKMKNNVDYYYNRFPYCT